MAVMKSTERSEFRIFAPSERKCLLAMRKDEFENQFGEFRQLLVMKRGQLIVAATQGNDRMGLATVFLEQFPEESESSFMFVTGPLGMKENMEGGGIPTPPRDGFSR